MALHNSSVCHTMPDIATQLTLSGNHTPTLFIEHFATLPCKFQIKEITEALRRVD